MKTTTTNSNHNNPFSSCSDDLSTTIILTDIISIFIVPFLSAFTPYFIHNSKKIISWVNCIGAGVLLGTCFFHLIPEIREEFLKLEDKKSEHDLRFELYTIIGFLFILVTEQFIDTYFKHYFEKDGLESHCQHEMKNLKNTKNTQESSSSDESHCHENTNSHSAIRSIAFVASLSLHSVIEGAALIFRAKSWPDNNPLLASLLIHKIAVGLTMGFTLKSSKLSEKSAKIALFTWSLFSPVGGILAWRGCDGNLIHNDVIPPLNAIGLGSFLYVLFFEIAPHEFLGAQQPNQKGQPNKFVKALVLVLGVILTFGLNRLIPHDHHDEEEEGHH